MTNTTSYSGSKKGAARFVRKIIESLNPDCVLITTTVRDISGDYYVTRAIEGSSADIAHQLGKRSSEPQPITLPAYTLDG